MALTWLTWCNGAVFPGQTLDWKKDIKVLAAKRWDTTLTRAQFKKATGLDDYPAYLKGNVDKSDVLHVFSSGDVTLDDQRHARQS